MPKPDPGKACGKCGGWIAVRISDQRVKCETCGYEHIQPLRKSFYTGPPERFGQIQSSGGDGPLAGKRVTWAEFGPVR